MFVDIKSDRRARAGEESRSQSTLGAHWLRRLAIAGATAGLIGTVGATAFAADQVPGLSFKISASTTIYSGTTPPPQANEVMRGRGIAVNNHSRIEFLAYTPTPMDVTTDDYLIGADSGKTYILHTKSGNLSPANDVFGGPAVVALGRVMGGANIPLRGAGGGGNRGPRGGGGGPPGGGGGGFRGGRGRGRGSVGSGFLGQIQLLDVGFKVEKLGAGDAIDGKPTQHYRITSDYRVVWADQSFPAHAVTEIWTTTLPGQIPNPFEPFIVADQSSDGPLIEYALKLRAARAQMEGTPIKVITTTAFSNIHDIVGFQSFVGDDPSVNTLTVVQQTQITGIQPADVDPKLVTVPDQNPPA